MILGIGTDILEIARIENTINRFDKRFTERIFTKTEQAKADKKRNKAAYYAKRFAAKEATVKALGTGIAKGIFWQDIEITNNESGAPLVTLSGKAAQKLDNLCPQQTKAQIHLSLSDERNYAQAFVIISAIPVTNS